MAQKLSMLATFAEDPGWVLSTNIYGEAHNYYL